MKSLKKFLIAVSFALAVYPGVDAYAQTPSQSPSSSLPLPAVDATKTRQRVVTASQQQQTQEASKTLDTSDVLVMTDSTPAKPANTKKGEASVESLRTSNSNQQGTDDAQPKPALGTKSSPVTASATPAQDNRHEQASEEAAIVPYYNNFFNTYRLGPEDIISVNVFGQDRYSRSGITVPPSGRISLALIPGGIFVNGKTVEEVAEAITKRYDEYIIEPQVSVSLDKASSYRYSVVGDVAQPGIRLMNRRLTVTEAISEAGGVLSTGDRSKVTVLRRQANGKLEPIAVNVSAIYKGKAPDVTYLVPGDQILVPGNKLKSFQKIMTFFPVLNFARIFTGGIF